MNMKQKWRSLWISKARANDGFTLVELIVVIAIVAVLGGVAVPAYSGYIEKADRAADAQLLADVNKAFAAACIVEGVDNFDADVNDPTIGENKKIGEIKVDGVAEFDKTFRGFFDNEGEFKKTTRLEYKPEIGGFFDPDADTEGKRAFTIGGKTYYISQSAIDRFKAATAFSEHVDELQNRVDGLASAYTQLLGAGDRDRMQNLFGDDYMKYLSDNDIQDDELGNATVLYVAEKSANMTAESAYNQLLATKTYLDSHPNASIDDYMSSLSAGGDPLATTAMLYGAVTAYTNGPGANDTTLKSQLANVRDSGTLLTLITSASKNDGFLAYCSKPDAGYTPSEQFVTDMNGYLGALEGINSSSGAFEGDLGNTNLWTGENAETLLGLIGK